MPSEISNSSSRIIVSNYSSGIFSTYPSGTNAKTPLVRFTFSFAPKKEKTIKVIYELKKDNLVVTKIENVK